MTTQLRLAVEELYEQLPPEYKGRFSLAEFMRHVDPKDMKQFMQIKQSNNTLDQKYPSVRRICKYLQNIKPDNNTLDQKYPNVKRICKHLHLREVASRKLREKILSEMYQRPKTIGGGKTSKRKHGMRKTGKRKYGKRKYGKRKTHKWNNPHGKFL